MSYEIDSDIQTMALLDVMKGIRDEMPRLVLHVIRNGMVVQTEEGLQTITPSAAWLNSARAIIALLYEEVASEAAKAEDDNEPDDPVEAALLRRARDGG